MTVQRTFSIIKPDATRRNLTGKSMPLSKKTACALLLSAACA